MDEEKLKKVNITDPDAKIMKHKDGSLKPSYNCQVAVDEKEQIIVAADLVDEENDLHQIEPMIENVKERLLLLPCCVWNSVYKNSKKGKWAGFTILCLQVLFSVCAKKCMYW